MGTEQMLENYAGALSGSHHVYVPKARRFLKECRGDFSRRAVERHLARLQREGYADGYVDLVFRTLKRFYRVNGLVWPFKRGEGPVIREREVFAPALDPAMVGRLIKGAQQGLLTSQEAALVALSTVYGLRRGEMAALDAKSVDLANQLIYVETAKHGRQRYHLIPPEILPHLANHRFSPISATKASLAYYSAEEKAGLPRIREVGWHAVRRILCRLLVDAGLPLPTVWDFLRWKRSDQMMVARYYSVTVVGDTSRPELSRADREIDEAVFAAHPFLPLWRGEV